MWLKFSNDTNRRGNIMCTYYENGLISQKNSQLANTAQKNALNFYKKNKVYCDSAYSYYRKYNLNKSKYVKAPKVIDRSFFLKNIGENIILILTANEVEESILLYELSETYKKEILSYLVDDSVYQVIKMGKYTLIHNHTLRTGDEFTRRAINAATKLFSPSYILLLGVCYGIDFNKYDLGTVFISNFVHGYRINFRDQEGSEETIFEADTEFQNKPSERLISRISSFFNFFQPQNELFSLDAEAIPIKIVAGNILSSNSLMSSKKVKDAIMSSLYNKGPKPLGGEMEACGIFKSNYFEENNFDNWLVIKSICDWGEKKNALDSDSLKNKKIKESIQAYAMMSTCVVFKTILDKGLL